MDLLGGASRLSMGAVAAGAVLLRIWSLGNTIWMWVKTLYPQ